MTGAVVALALAVPAVVGLVRLRRRYLAVRVAGPSMEPTLRHGDLVLVRRAPLDEVPRDRLVVVRRPPPWRGLHSWADGRRVPEQAGRLPDRAAVEDPWIIKRAVAVPGDRLPSELAAHRTQLGGRVPTGCLAVLGDNRAASVDSRRFGYVQEESVLGVVVGKLFPHRAAAARETGRMVPHI
ncbi:S26 family signal peptidase [Micromonospora coxensis]|uniref:Signal peptidase I n=1 Tax=Micromonospora coxensis TaxID=356852 RepID=A0A1C5I8I7_9ACTN|nr:S26 family signal peptidase [Micromonospora coxensis]SCG54587.1 signal peptidase I [Micromonospora coxensis]